jgi:hypothetical protein
MLVGVIIMVIAAGSTLLLSGVTFGVGPVATSVFGISPFSAILLFTGLVIFISGVAIMARGV